MHQNQQKMFSSGWTVEVDVIDIVAWVVGKIAAGKIRFRDAIAIHNTVESSSRHLTGSKFWVFIRGFLWDNYRFL